MNGHGAIRPSQPLTVGIWYDNKELNEFQLNNSDIITFHNYSKAEDMEKEIKELLKRNRPLICTEYMARTNGSTFETHLPILKKYNVGGDQLGFCKRQEQYYFSLGSKKKGVRNQKPGFMIFSEMTGTPFDKNEVAMIKNLTGKN